jgi:hypothetical protein
VNDAHSKGKGNNAVIDGKSVNTVIGFLGGMGQLVSIGNLSGALPVGQWIAITPLEQPPQERAPEIINTSALLAMIQERLVRRGDVLKLAEQTHSSTSLIARIKKGTTPISARVAKLFGYRKISLWEKISDDGKDRAEDRGMEPEEEGA